MQNGLQISRFKIGTDYACLAVLHGNTVAMKLNDKIFIAHCGYVTRSTTKAINTAMQQWLAPCVVNIKRGVMLINNAVEVTGDLREVLMLND